jgi:AhpD family alkylhydroperoxidase
MRLDCGHELPEASRAMSELERVVESSGLDPKIRELIKLRASQINGCAYCVDMHTKDAAAMGEDAQRLHLVAVWREAPVFSPRERAALAWTEALTFLSEIQVAIGTDTGAELKFDPTEMTVQAGAEVEVSFENRASVPHNLTFQEPITIATSTVVAPGSVEAVRFTAPAPGEYPFVCTLHPGMTGMLTVKAG